MNLKLKSSKHCQTLATGITEDARSDTDSADDELEDEEEIKKTL